MSEKHLHVVLVRHTLCPEELVSLGARLCYAGGDTNQLMEKVSSTDQNQFVNKIMDMGHESILEHASFSFLIEGVSRVLLAQLTRHRIASFSVQSQRYVSYASDLGYVIPPSIKELGKEAVDEYERQMNQIQEWYVQWQNKLGNLGEKSNEDARFVLPGACETRILLTMNVRELRHFFSLRICNRAQWEIRALANEMFQECCAIAPVLFRDAGPGCLRGNCPEKEKSCNQAKEMRKARQDFLNNLGNE